MIERAPVLVVGAGLAGLATAAELGRDALVLERDSRPGGTVRCTCIDGFWFDHVIHLLHFQDEATEARVRALPGLFLEPCPPVAWVETAAGCAQFPIQHHLGQLDVDTAVRCLVGLVEATRSGLEPPENYRDLLRNSFGEALCELFFLPYNRKAWRRPLEGLAGSAIEWNLHRPGLETALRGALRPESSADAYNDHAYYPRPPAGSTLRGMELLSHVLAGCAADLRCNREVLAIDPSRRQVVALGPDGEEHFGWERALVVTLPLAEAVRRTHGAPSSLVEAAGQLVHNLVLSFAVRVRGPRPDLGHWRYYPDESLIFTRLVFLHAFDPELAPPDGWPLLVEVSWPAEQAFDVDSLRQRVVDDVVRSGVLGGGLIEGADLIRVDPAYAVFTPTNAESIEASRSFLRERGIEPLGRYGRWEYSSMAQVLRDGFALGQALARGQER